MGYTTRPVRGLSTFGHMVFVGKPAVAVGIVNVLQITSQDLQMTAAHHADTTSTLRKLHLCALSSNTPILTLPRSFISLFPLFLLVAMAVGVPGGKNAALV